MEIGYYPDLKSQTLRFWFEKDGIRILSWFKSRSLVSLVKGWNLHFRTILNPKLYFFFVTGLNRLWSLRMHSDDFQTVGYYRFLSDTAISISRSRRCLTKEIRSQFSESDDRRVTKNTLNSRKMTESIRSDLVVVSSRISIPSDRIRLCEIHLGNYTVCHWWVLFSSFILC
jgi:hypothetical protein